MAKDKGKSVEREIDESMDGLGATEGGGATPPAASPEAAEAPPSPAAPTPQIGTPSQWPVFRVVLTRDHPVHNAEGKAGDCIAILSCGDQCSAHFLAGAIFNGIVELQKD